MKSTHYKDLVTDEELQQVMDNNPAMFRTKTGREWLIAGLTSTRKGYSNGSGVTSLLQMFKLIKKGNGTRNCKLTKKGLMYVLSVSEEHALTAEQPSGLLEVGGVSISKLTDILKSDSVYTLLRYGWKRPSDIGLDECDDHEYQDLYALVCELRNNNQ